MASLDTLTDTSDANSLAIAEILVTGLCWFFRSEACSINKRAASMSVAISASLNEIP